MPQDDLGSSNLSDDLSLLNEVDNEPEVDDVEEPEVPAPPKDKDKDEEEAPEDDKEEKELEEEEEEEPEPKDLLPHERPTVTDIKKEYPEFFKKFPALRDMMFREKQYSEVFPTIDDAKTASEDATLYNDLRSDVMDGTGTKLLVALKDGDNLTKFASNFLPNLHKADPNIHWQTIAPVLTDVVRQAYAKGKRENNENMMNSAGYLALFLFDDPKVASGEVVPFKAPEPKDEKLEKDRKDFENQKIQSFNNDIVSNVRSEMVPLIQTGFPKDMSKYMKDTLTRDIFMEVDKLIAADKAHMSHVNGIWAKAKQAGLSDDFKTRIKDAFLARAKSLVPGVRRRLLTQALGSEPVDKTKLENLEKTRARREPSSSGRVPNNKAVVPKSKDVDWSRTSDADFLSDRITLKK